MANHVRQQIREAAAALLTGPASTGPRVFRSRVYPLGEGQLPALRIYATEESAAMLTIHAPKLLDRRLTRDLVERIKTGTSIDEPLSTLQVECPKCGGTINENYKKFQCAACDFSMWKVIASRRIENEEAEALIRTRSIGPLQGFRSRLGRPFAAMLKLKDDFAVELDFGQSLADERDAGPVDFSGKQPLGKCPKCGARVFDHELAYVCEKALGPTARTCDFRTGKIILQRAIEPEQVMKLLTVVKTDLMHKFISKKGRPFSAFLARQPDGRIGFEFAPRQGARKAKGAPATPEPGVELLVAGAEEPSAFLRTLDAFVDCAPSPGASATTMRVATHVARLLINVSPRSAPG